VGTSRAAGWFAEHNADATIGISPSAPTKQGKPGAARAAATPARNPRHRQGDPLDRDAHAQQAGRPPANAIRPGLDRIRNQAATKRQQETSCRNARSPRRQ